MAKKTNTEKTAIFIFGIIFICVILVISILYPEPKPWQYEVFRIVLGLAAAGIASSIPGTISVSISKKIPGAIRATGAIGVFIIIYFFSPVELFTGTSPQQTHFLTVGISSSVPVTGLTTDSNFVKDKLSYKQNLPVDIPETTILLQKDKKYYLTQNAIIPQNAKSYEAKIRRPVILPHQGIPDDPTELCFSIKKEAESYKAFFIWDEKENKIVKDKMYNLDWLELCNNTFGTISRLFFTDVYAADNKAGWIVPSLEILENRNKEEGISFTKFKISSTLLKGLENANLYTYSIFVNNTPIYIDGWKKEDLKTRFFKDKGINLKFGLENLNFSGADYGKENIHVVFYFYSDKILIKTIDLRRSYVALRKVSKKIISSNDYSFNWEGEFVLGKKQDGYEVFIWSSRDKQEIFQKKKKFDTVSLEKNLNNAVSVIRPPLNDNKSYGLVIGFVDNLGRINFTFSSQKAHEVLSWVQQKIVPLKIAKSDARIYPMRGD